MATLTEAEAVYRTLGVSATQKTADVVLRRARVHQFAGHALSALTDAQQAVLACLDPREEDRVDAARVIAYAAQVQLNLGADPDIAVVAAEWALRQLRAQFVDGGRSGLPIEYTTAVEAAELWPPRCTPPPDVTTWRGKRDRSSLRRPAVGSLTFNI